MTNTTERVMLADRETAREFSAHFVLPATLPAPGVVVLQEIFGVNDNMRAIADWLADEGFVALVPDLFWRLQPDFVCDMRGAVDEKQQARAFELFPQFDADAGARDIQTALAWLRQHEACSGKVGALGYCLGGMLAYLAAARTDTDASVGYYGVNIPDLLGEAKNIRAPLLLHIAGADEFVPPAQQAAIHKGLDAHERVTLCDYADEPHGFARQGSDHYSAANAPKADARTLALLRQAL